MENPGNPIKLKIKANIEDDYLILKWNNAKNLGYDKPLKITKQCIDGLLPIIKEITIANVDSDITEFKVKISDLPIDKEITSVFYIYTNIKNAISIKVPELNYLSFEEALFYIRDRGYSFKSERNEILTPESIKGKWRKI